MQNSLQKTFTMKYQNSLSYLAAVLSLLIIALQVDSRTVDSDPEHAIFRDEEPEWNMQDWKSEKLYYATWAHLQACTSETDTFSSLDSLKGFLQARYEPLGDGRTKWEIIKGHETLTAPTKVEQVTHDLFWPQSRSLLSHAEKRCVAARSASCCCKSRISWGVYVRFESEKDAFRMLDEFKHVRDSKDRICIGYEDGGVRKELMDANGEIHRTPLYELEHKSNAGAVVGGLFAALVGVAAIAGGVYLYRNPNKYEQLKQKAIALLGKKGEKLGDDGNQPENPTFDLQMDNPVPQSQPQGGII